MSRLWIPGGRGMLGTRLAADAVASHDVLVTDSDTDIADRAKVAAFLDEKKPGAIIICAAWTAVDLAEQEADAAFRVNATGPLVVAEEAAKRSIRVVHLSTDYVFDGLASRPLTEDDPVGPVSVYGRTKLSGERAVVDHGGLVVRTSWLYAASHKNFVLTMLRLMAEREQLRVVADQRGRPTSVATLSAALLKLLEVGATGVVHVADDAGPTGISWHDFAVASREGALARGLPMKTTAIEAIPTSAYPTPAARPAWSVFDTAKYTRLTGQPLPPWQTRLGEVLDVLAAR